MKLGDFEVYPLLENVFHLDGGTMFGVVPKILWSRLVPADENNLITMHLNLLLVKTGDANVLIDAGLGDSLNDKMRKIYGQRGSSNLESELAKHGLKPDDIGIEEANDVAELVQSVPLSDHVGAEEPDVVRRDADGFLRPDIRTERNQKHDDDGANGGVHGSLLGIDPSRWWLHGTAASIVAGIGERCLLSRATDGEARRNIESHYDWPRG